MGRGGRSTREELVISYVLLLLAQHLIFFD